MEALRAVGFPGPTPPDSTEFQALARWRELMAEFASLDRVQGAVDARGAVARLGRLATNTVFQPESGDPPVHVLGLLEANGLEFDHLWLAGMTAEGWPLPVRAHPFLPLALQRAHRMPGAHVELELQRARAMLDRLARSAPEVVASHARSEGDRAMEPAPMIAAWAATPRVPPAARALDVILPTTLEVLADAVAPALPVTEIVGGGVATLTDQAACPFRAFARHRLRAEEPEQPHDGLDASERGELVHQVLAAFWQSLPQRTRSYAAAMPPDVLAATVEGAVDRAIGRLRVRRMKTAGPALLALERRRLVNLASRWLAFELGARGEFEVRWTEERRSLAIGRLSLNGRLDRVDRLADGRTIVIDYKTGGLSSVRAWLGPRPDEPQLPLYLVASETDARAVAFARIRAGEQRFVALAEDSSMLPRASVEWQDDYPTWTALVQAWREELTRLADGFADGLAEVAPKRPDSCRYCGLALLCRYDERAGATDDALTSGGDDE
jgi:probable DNA repair protein